MDDDSPGSQAKPTTMMCTPNSCEKDEDEHVLECVDCHRCVHYRCTKLPLYQLQLFLTTGYRRYKCINCVEVPTYLLEIVTEPPSVNQTIKELSSKLKESAVDRKIQTQAYEESELSLKAVISKQQEELKEQEDKFHQVGNPDYDNITRLEEVMKTKLEELGRNLKESLMKEVKDTNKEVEEKLEKVINDNKTFADSVKNAQPTTGPAFIPRDALDFRAIMNEARNRDLAEENDKRSRSCNVILHGVNESVSTDKDAMKKFDEDYAIEFFRVLELETTYKSIYRLGKPDPNRKRPIKIVMNNEEKKQQIIESLKNLKNKEGFRGLSVTDDYTMTERQMIKHKVEEAKVNNSNETQDSGFVWKVRGTPKNGLTIRRLPKRPTPQQQQH